MNNNEIRFEIDEAPPSANRIWRQTKTGKTYLDPRYKAFKDRVHATCWFKRLVLPNDWPYCAVEIIVNPKIRRGDVDNRIKAVLDALTFAKFWDDDSVVAEVKASFGEPSKTGKTTIVVSKRESKY